MIRPDQPPAYRRADLPVEDRVRDLLARMTLEEKARQMDLYAGAGAITTGSFPGNATVMARDGEVDLERTAALFGDNAPGGIHDLYPPDARATNALQAYAREHTRLGIPILFMEEALHGLGGPGNTIFPQAITLASAWNADIVERVGAAIGAETRAYGLHLVFAPVLDVARDPRWGRTEETYGEDTHLASRLGVAMCRGMMGPDLRGDAAIVAEPKHFAAYGATRAGVNCAPAHMGERELRSVVLPVFQAAVQEAGVLSIMCAYNAIDGAPCASSRWLLSDVLRDEWGFRGFVLSDLGAIRRLEIYHHTAASPDDAIAQSVAAGMDMQFFDFDNAAFQESVVRQVREGALPVEAVDRAVACILRVKFELGLFENPYTDTALAPRRVRCDAHRDLALEAARAGICLLKNAGGLLPLPRTAARIAVIGPGAAVAGLGDYTPEPYGFEPVTVLDGIRALAAPGAVILAARGASFVEGELEAIPAGCLRQRDGTPGLRGEYFASPDLAGDPALVRTDACVDFNWVLALPGEGMPSSGYSVCWTGTLVPDASFAGYLGVASQDSMRLWVDGVLALDGRGLGPRRNACLRVPYTFEAGRAVDLRVEFQYERSAARVTLGWSRDDEDIADAVRAAEAADIAIVCVGDSGDTCGESRDRASLDLPGRQGELVRRVHATGTPTVLVLQIGRPATLEWEAAHVPAILCAWFPGERGGQAIAEALFGVINPGGRLPISFPRSVGQIPMPYDRLRHGPQQHVDIDDEPRFPFGFGLSYTRFETDAVCVTPQVIGAGGAVTVSARVRNVGDRAGDEVVQLYLRDAVTSVATPEWRLRGFRRVALAPGEAAEVTFELGPADMAVLGRSMQWAVEPGAFDVRIGGPDGPTASFTVAGA